MFLKILTQPASKCYLANTRIRPDNERYFLAAGDPGSQQQCVQVACCLLPGEPEPASQLTLYGTIVTENGFNHPYSLSGQGCMGGVFVHRFCLSPGQRETSICLDNVMVVSCSKPGWQKAVEDKKGRHPIIPDAEPKLTPEIVKNFRIEFLMAEVKPVFTRSIQGTGPPSAAAANATAARAAAAPPDAAAAVFDLTIVDTLPTCLHLTSDAQEVALLLGDSSPENSTNCTVTCTAVYLPANEAVQIPCRMTSHVKNLVTACVEIPSRLAALLAAPDIFECRLTLAVSMATSNGIHQTAEGASLALHKTCGACNAVWSEPHQAGGAGYAGQHDAESLESRRRKVPGGGSGIIMLSAQSQADWAAPATVTDSVAAATPAPAPTYQQQQQQYHQLATVQLVSPEQVAAFARAAAANPMASAPFQLEYPMAPADYLQQQLAAVQETEADVPDRQHRLDREFEDLFQDHFGQLEQPQLQPPVDILMADALELVEREKMKTFDKPDLVACIGFPQ